MGVYAGVVVLNIFLVVFTSVVLVFSFFVVFDVAHDCVCVVSELFDCGFSFLPGFGESFLEWRDSDSGFESVVEFEVFDESSSVIVAGSHYHGHHDFFYFCGRECEPVFNHNYSSSKQFGHIVSIILSLFFGALCGYSFENVFPQQLQR